MWRRRVPTDSSATLEISSASPWPTGARQPSGAATATNWSAAAGMPYSGMASRSMTSFCGAAWEIVKRGCFSLDREKHATSRSFQMHCVCFPRISLLSATCCHVVCIIWQSYRASPLYIDRSPSHGRRNARRRQNHVRVPERSRWAADFQHARDAGAGLRLLRHVLRPRTLRHLRCLHLLHMCASARMLLQLVWRPECAFLQHLRPFALRRMRAPSRLHRRSNRHVFGHQRRRARRRTRGGDWRHHVAAPAA